MKSFVIIALAISLAACAAPQVDGPAIQIALSPAAQPVQTAVSACVPATEGLSVSIASVYPNMVALTDYDFYIQLGEPDVAPEFAIQIASDEVMVVTNTDNEIDRDQLADIFSGRFGTWEEVGGATTGAVHLWVGPEGDEARQAFELEFLRGAPVAGWAKLAATPQQLLDEVSTDANAVGILPAAWVDPNVNSIGTNVVLPLLAIASQEPDGVARQILVCLQSEIGQAALAEHYTPLPQ